MPSNPHWFESPPEACVYCGQELNHPNHKRRCDAVYSGFGPGFSFCELEAGHEGPHLLHPWNGSEWLIEGDTYTKTRPSRYESEAGGAL